MTKEENKKYALLVIELAACVLNGRTPDRAKLAGADMDLLYEAARRRNMTAIVSYALKSAGMEDERFRQEEGKAIAKNIMLDQERERLFAFMEENGIWHMPLKGAVLKELYPVPGMRQMTDNDILIDPNARKKVYDYFISEGYEVYKYGESVHDAYHKKPVLNFEIHIALFSGYQPELYDYYRDVQPRLIKDDERQYLYHFSPEDFYLSITAHEYKHYTVNGIGIRPLMDSYVYLKEYGSQLDMDYIAAEAQKLGLSDFEHSNRDLALALFDQKPLSSEQEKMLERFIDAGSFGSPELLVKHNLAGKGGGVKGKLIYIRERLIPPDAVMEKEYPTVYKHKILLPGFAVYRFGRMIHLFFSERERLTREIKALVRSKQ